MTANSGGDDTSSSLVQATRMIEETLLSTSKYASFGHNTSKNMDSRIMDYIHGSSPLFANIQKIMGGGSGLAFRFCNSFDDSPVHQLLLCLEVQDTSYLHLKEELGGADSHSYLDVVLTKSSTQKAFIRRVEFLRGQNDALQDLSN